MNIKKDNNNTLVVHENIVMPNAELPIKFFEHHHNATGPFCILHWHNELEMVYVQQGIITVNCESQTIEARPGEIIFINSNEPHSYYVLEAPIALYCCAINPVLLQGRYVTSYESRILSPTSMVTIFQNHITNDALLVQYFLTMWEEGEKQVKGYEYAIKANLYGIIALMVRNHIQSTLSNRQFLFKNRNLNNINKIIEYIEQHYQEDINLNELSDYLGFNRFYFCRLFKDITGFTPVKYINNYRIHQAVSLMQSQSSMSITQIATQVGYNDSNYFTRVFREVTNDTPSVYINKLKQTVQGEPIV
jgi:AraC-like DNA-binding protein/mannose-6-phosphate isomerase-like protein (cupin superfamily)